MSLRGQVQYLVAVISRRDTRKYTKMWQDVLKVLLSFYHSLSGMHTSTVNLFLLFYFLLLKIALLEPNNDTMKHLQNRFILEFPGGSAG